MHLVILLVILVGVIVSLVGAIFKWLTGAIGKCISSAPSAHNNNNEYRREVVEYFLDVLKKTNLPVVDTDMILEYGEVCHYVSTASLHETRAVRVTTRSYGSTPIAAGIRIGGGESYSESHQEWRMITSGMLYVTNKRILFKGESTNRNILYKNIISIEFALTELAINLATRQKTIAFFGINGELVHNLVKLLAKCGRQHRTVKGVLAEALSFKSHADMCMLLALERVRATEFPRWVGQFGDTTRKNYDESDE